MLCCCGKDKHSIALAKNTPYEIHIIYAVPSDVANRLPQIKGRLSTSISSWQGWAEKQLDGSKLRIAADDKGYKVLFLRLPNSEEEIRSAGVSARDLIEEATHDAVVNSNRDAYLVYYDGDMLDVSCGGAPWPPSQRHNVAVVYLRGRFSDPMIPNCNAHGNFGANVDKPGYLDYVALHEVMHLLGAAPDCAPNSSKNGHIVDDASDLMYGGLLEWLSPYHIDPGHHRYYKHGISGCYDMARNPFLDPLPLNGELPSGWREHMIKEVKIEGATYEVEFKLKVGDVRLSL
jgi:hypothetical protein